MQIVQTDSQEDAKDGGPQDCQKKLLAVCQIDVESVVVQKEHDGDKACHRRQILRCDKHEHCTYYGPEVEVNGRRRVQGRTEMWGRQK